MSIVRREKIGAELHLFADHVLLYDHTVCNAAGASKLTIGQIYKHYLWITVIFPLVAAVVLCILATLGIVF